MTVGELKQVLAVLADDVEVLVTQRNPELCSSLHPDADLATVDGDQVLVLSPNDDDLELDAPEDDEDSE